MGDSRLTAFQDVQQGGLQQVVGIVPPRQAADARVQRRPTALPDRPIRHVARVSAPYAGIARTLEGRPGPVIRVAA
ncbi:hypothetical protein AA12717_1726 [Gluconacetobacter sacchari DSM 12717]|uniref:Uncharacterized protein n=1 Tax=Gluconacetobacter sacchari DSM 12717 TaxID=1307940 RepID=A0ABQ0P6G5_9PROT|nr:hypothetical protein AA12717_1726 [Gluconacetobacter sacchari DSM 12717]